MRTLGVALVGLFAGFLVGFVAHDLVARAVLEDGRFPQDDVALALLVGALPPVTGVLGLVVALVVDGRRSGHRPGR